MKTLASTSGSYSKAWARCWLHLSGPYIMSDTWNCWCCNTVPHHIQAVRRHVPTRLTKAQEVGGAAETIQAVIIGEDRGWRKGPNCMWVGPEGSGMTLQCLIPNVWTSHVPTVPPRTSQPGARQDLCHTVLPLSLLVSYLFILFFIFCFYFYFYCLNYC